MAENVISGSATPKPPENLPASTLGGSNRHPSTAVEFQRFLRWAIQRSTGAPAWALAATLAAEIEENGYLR